MKQFVEKPKKNHQILVAEDNEDDYLLARDAIREARLPVDLAWVKDGEELMIYLGRQFPELILLDLNMPKKSGKEALREIKASLLLRRIPVVALTTSGSEEDIEATFDLGINSYIQKPVGFERFVSTMKALYDYWFVISKLPTNSGP
jgi:CheY-like chemotaxis protein